MEQHRFEARGDGLQANDCRVCGYHRLHSSHVEDAGTMRAQFAHDLRYRLWDALDHDVIVEVTEWFGYEPDDDEGDWAEPVYVTVEWRDPVDLDSRPTLNDATLDLGADTGCPVAEQGGTDCDDCWADFWERQLRFAVEQVTEGSDAR